jgi:hypothetical protein
LASTAHENGLQNFVGKSEGKVQLCEHGAQTTVSISSQKVLIQTRDSLLLEVYAQVGRLVNIASLNKLNCINKSDKTLQSFNSL